MLGRSLDGVPAAGPLPHSRRPEETPPRQKRRPNTSSGARRPQARPSPSPAARIEASHTPSTLQRHVSFAQVRPRSAHAPLTRHQSFEPRLGRRDGGSHRGGSPHRPSSAAGSTGSHSSRRGGSGSGGGSGAPPGSPLEVPTELAAGTPHSSLSRVHSSVWHEQRGGSAGASARSADTLPRRSPPLRPAPTRSPSAAAPVGLGLDPHIEPLTELALCATEPLADTPPQAWAEEAGGGPQRAHTSSAARARRRRASQGDLPQRTELPEAQLRRRQLFTSEVLSPVRRAAAPPAPEPPRSASSASLPPLHYPRPSSAPHACHLCLRVGLGGCGCG